MEIRARRDRRMTLGAPGDLQKYTAGRSCVAWLCRRSCGSVDGARKSNGRCREFGGVGAAGLLLLGVFWKTEI